MEEALVHPSTTERCWGDAPAMQHSGSADRERFKTNLSYNLSYIAA